LALPQLEPRWLFFHDKWNIGN